VPASGQTSREGARCGTAFTGTIGSLQDLTPAKSYSAGLFAHEQVHPASLKPVLVVDYWVE
jgi:hypothetical protein